MKQAERRKFHYIYKITRNDGSGKYYIGMHSTDDLEDGYFGSGQRLWKSIKKHGKEKHSKEILEFLPSRSELKKRERELVNEEILDDVLCMNLKLGGEGGSHGRESEVWKRAGYKEKVSNLQSAGLKIAWQNECNRASWIEARKNVWADEEYRMKRIPRVMEYLAIAAKIAASEKANKKRKETMAANGHMQGEKNSQFGTCWVTNGVKPVTIKKEELDKYLANGYRRGRK